MLRVRSLSRTASALKPYLASTVGIRRLSSETPHRVHNFSAGPSCLPIDILKEAQAEMISYQGSGMSFMEMSHRDAGGPVQNTISSATRAITELLQVPDNYHVLFFHGGAHGQFAGEVVFFLHISLSQVNYPLSST